MTALPIVDIHTPTSSFSLVHSFTQESLLALYDKLSRKEHTDYEGQRVGPGWLKYEFNGTVWNLDDDADYTIFTWRLQQTPEQADASSSSVLSASASGAPSAAKPSLYLRNPSQPLPSATNLNPSFHLFKPSKAHLAVPASVRSASRSPSSRSIVSRRSRRSVASLGTMNTGDDEDDGVPKFKKEFDRFHNENGVRTVMGSVGPVRNVRMLLKSGYRHVYVSRIFAMKNGFIPKDAAPGQYGYSGLVNIGKWPITLYPSKRGNPPNGRVTSPPSSPASSEVAQPRTPTTRSARRRNGEAAGRRETANGAGADPNGGTPVVVQVYLSEEPHFDVVLGRSFFEKRQIRTSAVDMTDVTCLDTGEKVECELVVLKDGRGEIVTVT
ncbi:uncharacterized protein SCHCODRAFT_02560891 [Schizophyllum commune H4-8]|uniref:Uncharacterized protein n=1 Tax=Schizophyllum commune (strain H4-8 / FGSC 9210) TaxID=578458 RepID=D8PSU0_SCHCM|nr:uncharacterized protein SCHCODRAFT_02560891 [Schizophyllum commune H4-8]KAI5899559.1 hypothetical protein SCHCODRAFT_02560891 [Schizophyllum commune H4-8]